jgi:MFS transporter, UMF1 family
MNAPVTSEDPREIFGWKFYDFSSAAFLLIVVTVFFGPYLTASAHAVADARGRIRIVGIPVRYDSLFPYCVAASVLLEVMLLPLLGAVADSSHRRKRLLKLLTFAGAVATVGLGVLPPPQYRAGGALFVLANLSYGAAIVVYNSYLPDITAPERLDRISASGWSYGYVGGSVLLVAVLALFVFREQAGLSGSEVVRTGFAAAGFWWVGFAQVSFARLRVREGPAGESGGGYATAGLRQLRQTFSAMRRYPEALRFLAAYLIYSDGIQTVIVVATLFADVELGIPQLARILDILMIQVVAFAGAHLCARLAERIGAKRVVAGTLCVWSAVVVLAFAGLRSRQVVTAFGIERRQLEFFLLSALAGIVLGGSQAISRSLFSRMVPKGREAEFFSFYEISERGTSWLGPLLFGLANQLFGSLRFGILSLIVLFLAGLAVLTGVDVRAGMEEARGDAPPRVGLYC